MLIILSWIVPPLKGTLNKCAAIIQQFIKSSPGSNDCFEVWILIR